MSISCSFCIHINPDRSKFCNECGSPLRLKPCAACGAVNDVNATHCHRCAAELNGGSVRAHEPAESMRARESIESPNGADPLGTDAPRLFFDQYLDSLRRDVGRRMMPAEEASADTAGPPSAEADTDAEFVPEALRPLRVTPVEQPERGTASSLLYVVGAALLVIGIMGYGYYQYGLPAPAERWLGGFAAAPSTPRASSLLTTASRAITRPGDGAALPSAASDPLADGASADPGTTASATASESAAVSSRTVNATEPISASAQTAATTSTATSPGASTSRTQASQAAPSGEASAAAHPASVAAVSAKQVARAAPKRPEPRRTAAARPMTAAPAPAPVPTPPNDAETNARSASPLAPVCTRGVAALGLCDPNRQETN